jgi:mRNA interferase RelE/StbE
MHRIELTHRAKRELDKLPLKDFKQIDAVIRALMKEPRPQGVKKLKGAIHRVGAGGWRIIYAVFDKDKLIIVGKVARRSGRTYDKLEELL